MKLLVTVVQDQDVQHLLEELTVHGFSATKLASTGGFLKVGNTTLIVGVDDQKVPEVLEIIKQSCKRREQTGGSPFSRGGSRSKMVNVGGATVFIVDVERFERI